jgi:hypothetical protein
MAWVKVQQRQVWGRPAGEVRVGVNDVRGTRLINIILADSVLSAAGLAVKDRMTLERGEGEDAGWVRVIRGEGETRLIGKLPQTKSGIVRFTLPAELPLLVAASTACDEWETGKGWVALRLPAAVVEGRAAPAAKKIKAEPPMPAPRPAIPLVEPKPAPKPATRPAIGGGQLSPHSKHVRNSDPPKPRDADPNCPLTKLPAEDLAEARDMMRKASIGAKALQDYFGWEHAQAVKIAAAIRDEMALAGRAA